MIFTRTKYGADKVVKLLSKKGIRAEAIHGNKSQNARQNALGNFKSGKIKVLIATDIAARGIDIEQLSLVINYEIPNIPETYVHRIGRTGRAEASGVAVSFCMDEEKPFLRDIQKLIDQDIDVVEDHPFVGYEPDEPAVDTPKPKQKHSQRKPGNRSGNTNQDRPYKPKSKKRRY